MQKGKPYEVIDGDICQCVPLLAHLLPSQLANLHGFSRLQLEAQRVDLVLVEEKGLELKLHLHKARESRLRLETRRRALALERSWAPSALLRYRVALQVVPKAFTSLSRRVRQMKPG